MGTAHLLDALRDSDTVRSVVVVTTDKVYQNREWFYPYREDDALGGHDPYSASKAAAEVVIACKLPRLLPGGEKHSRRLAVLAMSSAVVTGPRIV